MFTPRSAWPLVVAAAIAALGPQVAHAQAPTPAPGNTTATSAAIDGTVFIDENGDGLLNPGEATVPAAAVSFENGAPFVKTDASGKYRVTIAGDGFVWVRVPDGFDPTPVYRALKLADGDRTVDLPLRRSRATGDLTFVHASDSHYGNGIPAADAQRSFALAAAVEPAPHFLVLTGDMTDSSSEQQFKELRAIVDALPVPFVPVVGNHDAYDGGGEYAKYFGPRNYCFDQGGVRFLVLSYYELTALTAPTMGLVDKCLADKGDLHVAAFTHMPLDDNTSLLLASHGVETLFTGHWHSNRLIQHGALEEVNTETFVMGGIDATPAGYRIASFDGHRFHYTHHTVVDDPVLHVLWPPEHGCVTPGTVEVIVAAEAGKPLGDVMVTLDGDDAILAARGGGWDRIAKLAIDSPGDHQITVSAPGGDSVSRSFCVATPNGPGPSVADWTQLQGSAEHHGVTARRIEPPLGQRWARSVGGHLRGGSVVVGDGRVFVPVVDLADGKTGGVVALDAHTGEMLWERRVGFSVHNAPALVGGLVVFSSANGVVHAVSADSGADVWSVDLGQGISQNFAWLYAAPTVADGVVYVGVERRFVALDGATGRELWSRDPSPKSFWLGSYTSAAVSGGVVVTAVSRGADGIVAWDAMDGRELWRVPQPLSTAIQAGVLIDKDRAYLANTFTNVFAVDLLAPAAPTYVTWQTRLHHEANDWTYSVMGTPALASNRLVVPTMLGDVVGLDPSSGAEVWRYQGTAGPLRPTHERGTGIAAFVGAPVVTKDLVWVGGASGKLSALDLDSGRFVWSVDLGAPILSAAAPAGDLLIVGSFDGTVHALEHVEGSTCPDGPGCLPGGPGGGGCVVCRATAPAGPGPWWSRSRRWSAAGAADRSVYTSSMRWRAALSAAFAAAVAACGQGAQRDAGAGPDADPGATRLVVIATDGIDGPNLPAMVVLRGPEGEPLHIGKLDMYSGTSQDQGYCDLADGVLGTWQGILLQDGTGEIPIGDTRCDPAPAVPYGTYTVRVMHGIDHEMFETTVTLAPRQGKVTVVAPLERAWTADGALAADLHVHADPSNDSNLPVDARIVTELVAGVQVIGASDHNYNGSFDTAIDDHHWRGQVASVPGNEVTIDMMHANVFPARVVPGQPNNGATDYTDLNSYSAAKLFEHMRALPDSPFVQLNHPRLRFAAYFDYAGWDGVSWPPPMPIDFDGLEVLHGMYAFNAPGDRRVEQAIGDFYTFMRHGRLVTALGNSDTHHMTGTVAGSVRSYVFSRDQRLDPFDVGGFVDALRGRRVMLTTGPWLAVDGGGVGPGELARATGGSVPVTIAVRQASFVRATRLRLWVGGELSQTMAIPAGGSFDWSGDVAVGARDTWIGVDVLGDEAIPTDLTGDGLVALGGVVPAALINPILVDVDGDGRYSAASAAPKDAPDLPAPPPSGRRYPLDCGVPPPAR
jgi:outer membrane protein assembly factor BamB